MSKKILLFGGTTEGRIAAEKILNAGVCCTVCVATEYGAQVMDPHPLLTLHTGRLDRAGMIQMIREDDFACAVDATHPHAAVVTVEIIAACRETGLPYLRLERDLASFRPDSNPSLQEDFSSAKTGKTISFTEEGRTISSAKAGKTISSAEAGKTISSPVLGERSPGPGEKSTGSGMESTGTGEGFIGTEAGNCRMIRVTDIAEAGSVLGGVSGRILVTTGSKELEKLAAALKDPERIYARILPSKESLDACSRAGLTGKQIIAMQGPFDTEMNCAMIRHTGTSWLLTKETGRAGGYPEKMEAAKRCGIGVVVICPPATAAGADATRKMNFEEVIAAALKFAGKKTESFNKRKKEEEVNSSSSRDGERVLTLIGIGVGAREARTLEAVQALKEADTFFGAKSVLHSLEAEAVTEGKTIVPLYESRAVLNYLREHPECRNAAAVFSGDSGFYSGASSMLARIREKEKESKKEVNKKGKEDSFAQELEFLAQDFFSELKVRTICGISSVSWFAARAGIPWQDWKILSSHGRICNVTGMVRRHPKCFLLLSGVEDIRRTGAALADAQVRSVLGDVRLIYGYELSRPAEEIRSCTPQDLCAITKEGLYVLYIEHEEAKDCPVLPGLPDSAFIRGKAPMTSSEIRALSLCRLGLFARAVVWDIGAGTGSVSVEAARTCPEGFVWAIEAKAPAAALLRENREKFCLQNLEIIEGHAPEVLKELPAPTHAFIGGSGGEIGEILELLLQKNPEVRVVVNCITIETLIALRTALQKLPVCDVQYTQVSVQRGDTLGRYHYLRALNPVFIVSFSGKKA